MSTTRFGADHEGAATVLREIGYRGRQALVVTKQALGLSRRGDKTFYIEQFSRLLRSGSVNASGIATIGRTDGAGAQAQALMSAIAFARAHNLPYVHRPFSSIEHAETDMPAWVQLWEDYFNLGAGEASLDINGPALVALDHLRFVPHQVPVIAAAEHYLHYCNQDLLAWESILPLLRSKYWQNKTARPRTSELRVAVHMRRGDVTADNKKVANNFTPNATFVNTLTRLKGLAGGDLPPLRIEVFSQGEPSMFDDLRALGARASPRRAGRHHAPRDGRGGYPRDVEGRLQLHGRRVERRHHAVRPAEVSRAARLDRARARRLVRYGARCGAPREAVRPALSPRAARESGQQKTARA